MLNRFTKQTESRIHKFCSKYRARLRRGEPIERPTLREPSWAQTYIDLSTYRVESVEVLIGEEDFSELLSHLDEISSQDYLEFQRLKSILGDSFINRYISTSEAASREAEIRRRVPGVQKAWENYQTMLKLAGG